MTQTDLVVELHETRRMTCIIILSKMQAET